MPAQKLTPARVIHLIIVLLVLSTAFFWRTFNPTDAAPILLECQPSKTCQFHDKDSQGELRNVRQDQWQLRVFDTKLSEKARWRVQAKGAQKIVQLDVNQWIITGDQTETITLMFEQEPAVKFELSR
ncbi:MULTISPECIES: hypothetical protein [unclassified Vibrio]|uniref:Uncharacterized protein n=1 Tax=Vibrio sp. HB236076 TaxID=3232307 RepID=A0AB39H956_9VIBR|nr:hypothetical protein [Vibrio sp. HB161653]MDP5253403.1 hypothetical protein [Vibrio sp. HB161653]